MKHNPNRKYCPCCEKSLRYWTTAVFFTTPDSGKRDVKFVQDVVFADPLPMTVAAAKALKPTNMAVISITRHNRVRYDDNGKQYKVPADSVPIASMNLWDGESYLGYPRNGKDAIFCSTTCAIRFAGMAWRAGYRVKQPS